MPTVRSSSLGTRGTNGPVNLADRLVAYWNMDDGLASPFTTNVRDSSGDSSGTFDLNRV